METPEPLEYFPKKKKKKTPSENQNFLDEEGTITPFLIQSKEGRYKGYTTGQFFWGGGGRGRDI